MLSVPPWADLGATFQWHLPNVKVESCIHDRIVLIIQCGALHGQPKQTNDRPELEVIRFDIFASHRTALCYAVACCRVADCLRVNGMAFGWKGLGFRFSGCV